MVYELSFHVWPSYRYIFGTYVARENQSATKSSDSGNVNMFTSKSERRSDLVKRAQKAPTSESYGGELSDGQLSVALCATRGQCHNNIIKARKVDHPDSPRINKEQ